MKYSSLLSLLLLINPFLCKASDDIYADMLPLPPVLLGINPVHVAAPAQEITLDMLPDLDILQIPVQTLSRILPTNEIQRREFFEKRLFTILNSENPSPELVRSLIFSIVESVNKVSWQVFFNNSDGRFLNRAAEGAKNNRDRARDDWRHWREGDADYAANLFLYDAYSQGRNDERIAVRALWDAVDPNRERRNRIEEIAAQIHSSEGVRTFIGLAYVQMARDFFKVSNRHHQP